MMPLLCRRSIAYEICVLLLLYFDGFRHVAVAGKSSGLCISPGGRFPAFSSEGKPPRKVSKGPKDFAVCRVFRHNTCCDVAQTFPALVSIRRLASSGEANHQCLHLWELLECSICNPRVGVRAGPPILCASFCDMILKDCSNAYFAIDPKSQVLSPCRLNDIVCGRASEWASNGTELCRLAGFSVLHDVFDDNDDDEPYCYGGKASLESISGSWKASRSDLGKGVHRTTEVFEGFKQWFRRMPVNEKVRWAIGGMVLTSGLVFVSKRKNLSRRQKQAAAIVRAARRIEARIDATLLQDNLSSSVLMFWKIEMGEFLC
ncbi:hypothetical protein HPP92_010680 [Vanilla planifolia]|uniref:Folate receptor-like domain-containing protein n=1 Tax=Vanilla planifolia TaxID=51239 RepID=A0A835R475_VANPL|nr:hypothetical protein HPP92_010680 [Vanilla planifolia]